MKRLNMRQKRGIAGWIFIMPWFVGLLLFFIQPMVTFIQYSFTNFRFSDTGGYILSKLEDGPFANYIQALTQDSKFPVQVVNAFKDLIYQTPIIVFFSLFVALILNQKFRGRTAMRAIFFLPIIITAGVISSIIRGDLNSIAMSSSGQSSNLFNATQLMGLLLESGLPENIVNFLTNMVSNVGDLIWKSGIQILIFMSALLSIPSSYYEVAVVEGATGWETFWKVTLPIVSPFVLANTVYTIVDSITRGNGAIDYILEYSIKDMNYSYAAAMSWIYFFVVVVILMIVFLLSKRFVFYGNKK
ncbi:MAG: sugar ABC transporter permease [Oscillospiraceae bacterium]